jgi:hypothetical protein
MSYPQPSHEIKITSYKTNKKKNKTHFPTILILKDIIEKKFKNDQI